MTTKTPSRHASGRIPAVLMLLSILLGITHATAQEQTVSSSEEEAVTLSPFTVNAETGYTAQRTLSGSRLNSELKNVPQSISVLTEDFLADMDVLNPEEAMLYSLNVENRTEYSDAVQSNGTFNRGVAFNDFSGRVRGIDFAGRMRDFFNTNLESDGYNLAGGISVSSGPNAVIFGLGGSGGVISSGYKKAMTSRDALRLEFRTDSEGSIRVVADANKVLVDDKLAIRFVALNDNFETYRDGSKGEQERYFLALTASPWKGATFNAYFEDVDIDKNVVRNVVAYDGGVTAYLQHVANGGDPYYDNSGSTAILPGWEGLVERNNLNRPYWFHNPDGTQEYIGLVRNANNSVNTIPPERAVPNPLDRWPYSLPADSPLVSGEHNVHGLTTDRHMYGEVYGLLFNQKLTENLYLELGYNRETGWSDWANMATTRNAQIKVDVNMFMPDKVTPNPNKGMYYVDDWAQSTQDFNDLESFRATISWDLDLTEKSKWLGHHKVMGLYTQDQTDRMWAWQRTKTVQAADVGTYVYDARSGINNGQTQYRWYLDQNFSMINPWNGWEGGLQPDGSFVYAAGNSPAKQNVFSQLNKTTGATAAIQSYLLDEHLVTTVGYRKGWFQDGNTGVRALTNQPDYAWGYPNIEDVDRSGDNYSPEYTADAINYGFVYHLTDSNNRFGSFSLVYNYADIFSSPTPNYYPDGTKHVNPIGTSDDYSVMWSAPNGKFGGKLTYYDTTAANLRSTDWRGFLENPTKQMENKIGLPGAENSDSSNYAEGIANGEIEDLNGNVVTLAQIAANPAMAFNTNGFDVTGNTSYGMTADRESTGYELELWANPTENITVRFTGSMGDAIDQNAMKGWGNWIEARADYYEAWATWEGTHRLIGSNQTLNRSNSSVSNRFASVSPAYSTLSTIPLGEGTRVGQNVGLRTNTTVRYSFKTGALKGLDIGATYRYREASVIGYVAVPATDAFAGFPYPPTASTDFRATDLDQPVYGKAQKDTDLFLAYRGKLKERRYTLRFNVRNLFDNVGVVPQRADSSGKVSVYNFHAPRTYSFTLGLDF